MMDPLVRVTTRCGTLGHPKVCLLGTFHGVTGEMPTRTLTKLSDSLNRCFWEHGLPMHLLSA